MTANETIHRPRSKFRLPSPIEKDGRSSRVNPASGDGISSQSSLLRPPPRFNAKDSGIPTGTDSNGMINSSRGNSISSNNVPGRPRRRPHPQATAFGSDTRVHPPIAEDAPSTKEHLTANQYNLPVSAAVLLWYLLGVVSISSSKVLLSTHGVPPLLLTLQQLIIGVTLLRTLLFFGDSINNNSSTGASTDGLRPIPMQNYSLVIEGCPSGEKCEIGQANQTGLCPGEIGIVSSIFAIILSKLKFGVDNQRPHVDLQLLSSAMYFTLGFLFTNYGFRSGSAAFVETIKAAEPITSASVAVAWGIEQLSKEEIGGLSGIVVGVIMSTVGQHAPKAETNNRQSTSMAFFIVMISNLCFSFRGLHQKLFRASPQGKASSVNDLNLQFRMQQIGVLLLIGPSVLGYGMWFVHIPITFNTGKILQYVPLALVNGIAFTSYNLASTYVLTRITVVHHAALNCIRRVFAVVVTSVVFGLSINALQLLGIATSVGGFFSFSHYKFKKGRKEKRRRDLRKKYGVVSSKKVGKGWSDEKKESDNVV
ncbi:hypothetical protein ACHAWO_001946 [Cyclotella atomus]|uniref:Sugar phosphate transporter domain-containing protein n=1 Tax=Cyclotella atomus TaxID=382360 RepID=A0ABD3NGY0_9STRA